MSLKDYRARKVEYYGRSMSALNLYIYFLLPAYLIYHAVMFTWHITVSEAGFRTPAEFLMNFTLLILALAALISIYGVDKYGFFSNIVFLLALSASRIITTFFPTLLTGTALADASADAAASAMGGDMMVMNVDMAGMAAMGDTMAGMGASGAMPPESSSLLAKLLGKFITTGEDITMFTKALECEIFVLVCLFFVLFFIGNRAFFFSSLQDFRSREETAD